MLKRIIIERLNFEWIDVAGKSIQDKRHLRERLSSIIGHRWARRREEEKERRRRGSMIDRLIYLEKRYVSAVDNSLSSEFYIAPRSFNPSVDLKAEKRDGSLSADNIKLPLPRKREKNLGDALESVLVSMSNYWFWVVKMLEIFSLDFRERVYIELLNRCCAR